MKFLFKIIISERKENSSGPKVVTFGPRTGIGDSNKQFSDSKIGHKVQPIDR